MAIRKVWFEEGCISCNLCEDLCSEVFEVPAGSVSRTRKRYEAALADDDVQERTREAADSCPVEVIKLDEG